MRTYRVQKLAQQLWPAWLIGLAAPLVLAQEEYRPLEFTPDSQANPPAPDDAQGPTVDEKTGLGFACHK